MVTQPFRYPLDPTGNSPDNLVVGEQHTLPNRTIRAFAPLYGAFFTESLVLRDRSNNQVLQRGVQYRSAELYEFPTGRWGKEICGIVLVTDPTVSNDIELDYQALGGEYSTNVDAIIQMFDAAMLDRPASWPDILGKPDEFSPAAHFHDVGDIYGFEYVVNALERLRNAILVGDAASHDEIFKYIDRQDDFVRDEINASLGDFSGHISNTNNPHNTTKAQIGLGSVENYPPVTSAEAIAGNDNTRYMTPQHTVTAIVHHAGLLLQTHTGRTDNPHSTTKAQVGLGSVENYPVATQVEAQTGTNNTTYMTPLRTAQSITVATASFSQHLTSTNNPHNTTKTQVGLGNVENYLVASQAESEAGTSNTTYMTPLRTAQAIAVSGASFNQHIARTDNPHSTTKGQVGLGNVENYLLANQAEAETGTSNILYMSPLRVKQAITFQATTSLNQHIARTDNPHNTTKAQVGLGNVLDYPVATQAEAQAGTVDNRYMTPLRTAQAIITLATAPLNQHTARTDNPHSTTRSQVGLGNVENYLVANQAEAQAGASNTLYMTPLRTAQAITALATTSLNQHIARTDNPHSTTKAQVGLGSVENYGVAQAADIDNPVSASLYMTPVMSAYMNGRYMTDHNNGGSHDWRYMLKSDPAASILSRFRIIRDGEQHNGNEIMQVLMDIEGNRWMDVALNLPQWYNT